MRPWHSTDWWVNNPSTKTQSSHLRIPSSSWSSNSGCSRAPSKIKRIRQPYLTTSLVQTVKPYQSTPGGWVQRSCLLAANQLCRLLIHKLRSKALHKPNQEQAIMPLNRGPATPTQANKEISKIRERHKIWPGPWTCRHNLQPCTSNRRIRRRRRYSSLTNRSYKATAAKLK